MRIATLILALLLVVPKGVQALAAALLSSVNQQGNLYTAAARGLCVPFLYIIGAAFALAKPTVSAVAFGMAVLLGSLHSRKPHGTRIRAYG